MSDFRFPPLLDNTAWELVFTERPDLPALLGRPAPRVDEPRMHLDLSRVEWVDFGVLARALLLIDAAIGAGVEVTLTMPALGLLRGEAIAVDGADDAAQRAAHRESRQRASRRGQAFAFMRHAGFERALTTAGWPPEAFSLCQSEADLLVQDGTEPLPDSDTEDHIDHAEGIGNTRRRRLVPLRWLRQRDGASLRESAEFRAVETDLQDLGVSVADAVAICETIFAELVENVARHGGPAPGLAPNALVGAALLGPSAFRAQRADAFPGAGRLTDLADAADGSVLRVLVGDCGPSARGPEAPPSADPVRGIRDALESIAEADDVADRKAEITGLRRVSKMVHSYRGRVTVRSGDFVASLALSEVGDAVGPLEHASVNWMPGTLFEALVLTESRSATVRRPWRAHPAANQDLRLHLVTGSLEPELGLTPADRGRFESAVAQARAQGEDTGVVVMLPAVDRGRREAASSTQSAIRRALDFLSHGAEGVAVAAILPETNRHLLDLQAIEFAEERNSSARGEAAGRAAPILLFGAQGDPVWCCGHRRLRTVLEGLIAADGVMETDQAMRLWRSRDGDPGGFADALHSARHLVTVDRGCLLLRLSPLVVLRSLRAATAELLTEEVARGGSGVSCGRFRTPNLSIVSRWIDMSGLLEGTVGTSTAAFLLARATEAEAAWIRSTGARVVAQASTCPPALVAGLSDCLGLRAAYFRMDSELDPDGWSSSAEPPAGANVVLCTDVIGTENTVRRAAAAIAGHATPAVIACVLDARASHGPIRVLNREIPVVSLARVDVSPLDPLRAEGPVVDIDPVLRCATPPRAAESRFMAEEELLDLFGPAPGSQSGALRLGHIKSERRMHFSASLRLDRLLRRADARDRVVHAMAGELRRAFDELDQTHGRVADPGRAEIRYPSGEGGSLGRLARALRDGLEAAGMPAAEPHEVHRFVAGAAWETMPLPEAAAKRVAIVDFGIVTGTTVNQLIRDAARRGAERIVVIALVDQLPEGDPGMLGMVRAVSGPDGAAEVPTTVRAGTRASLGGVDAAHCPICASRNRYADVGTAPERLRRHAKRLYDVLAPRGSEEIFETAPADLFNVPVTHDDAVDFLRWHHLLERALRDTAARKEVLDRLIRLAAGGAEPVLTQRGLIRLLAAEQQWLKLPPLRFAKCREQLALVCEDELGKPSPEPRWLRIQALMVLVAAAPEEFVRRLPRLLESAVDEQIAVDQLMLDVYRLVRRPSHDTPVGPQLLRVSLIRCRDYLERSQAGSDREVIEDFVQVVRELILLVDQPRRAPGSDLQSAWARLREEWCRPVEHHHFEGRILRVRNYVELLQETELGKDIARAAEDDWEACARLVGESAIEQLRQLRPILSGDHVREFLGPLSQKRLVELSRTDSVVPVTLAERLHGLAGQPRRPSDGNWVAERRAVLELVNWWHRVFFATHRPHTESRALLVELLLSAPTSLSDFLRTVSAAHRTAQSTISASDADVRVFCPRDLLLEVVEHVFDNARRHRTDDGAEQRFELGLRRPALNLVSLTVRNTGSRPRPAPGKGLNELDRSLRPFGGSLTGAPLADGDWSFEAVITLQTWQEV